MKITLTAEESLRVEATPGMLTIEAPTAATSYSPFHMLGSALGMCTFSVLQSWAGNRNISADDLKIDVNWSFVEGQHRLASMKVKLDWPTLPPELWQRATRAASLCGIHNTLTHSPEISVEAVGGESPAIEVPVAIQGATPRMPRARPAIPQGDEQTKRTSAS
jgi:uncharacterized OsmC-like protein